MFKIFGREPVLWLGLLAALVQFFSAFVIPVSVETQGVIAAFALAAVGVLQALVLRDGSTLAAITGLFKAGIALGLAFGLKWSPEQQAEAMVTVQAVLAVLVRPQVTAPVDANGNTVPRL